MKYSVIFSDYYGSQCCVHTDSFHSAKALYDLLTALGVSAVMSTVEEG